MSTNNYTAVYISIIGIVNWEGKEKNKRLREREREKYNKKEMHEMKFKKVSRTQQKQNRKKDIKKLN